MAPLVIPPIKTGIPHPRKQPIVLPAQLDPSCVMCLFPLKDNHWHDYSGKGNHGVIIGPSWTAKGRLGTAFYFDGIDDRIQFPDDISLDVGTGDFTLEVWFKCAVSLSGYGVLVSKWKAGELGYTIFIITSGVLIFRTEDTTAKQLGTVGKYDDDIWHHVITTRIGSLGIVYIDGVEVKRGTVHATNLDNTHVFRIGQRSDANAWRFKGFIDEVRIYKRALAADEIKALYEQGAEVRS